jgi:hypothetical protein
VFAKLEGVMAGKSQKKKLVSSGKITELNGEIACHG